MSFYKENINRLSSPTPTGVSSYPSRIVYSIDVPEVTNVRSDFIYNFYLPNESTQDTNILSSIDSEGINQINLLDTIVNKKSYDYTDVELSENRSKIPRYVKITFDYAGNLTNLSSNSNSGIPQNILQVLNGTITTNQDKITFEDNFASSYFTSLHFDNGTLVAKILETPNINDLIVNVSQKKANNPHKDLFSEADLLEFNSRPNISNDEANNSYVKSLQSLTTHTQVCNSLLNDVSINAAGDPLSINNQVLTTVANETATSQTEILNQFSEEEYRQALSYIAMTDSDDLEENTQFVVAGFIIKKFEILDNGSKVEKEKIIVENPIKRTVIDTNVKYGAYYAYEIRTILQISYKAFDNFDYSSKYITSLIASKPVTTVVQTIEFLPPPPPTDIKLIWDYDRINPKTLSTDPLTNQVYENSAKRGSLYLCWSFPINSQRDIKKFQVFRRKSVDECFELIKMYDFDDSEEKYANLESYILPNLIEITNGNPKKSYYDDDFEKDSEYIYALASIDAHGMTSGYSEQFQVKFDTYKNKLITKVISKAGAPKEYPNVYLNEDLFLDCIKTSNKKTCHVYFAPDCYGVHTDDNFTDTVVFKTGENRANGQYKINFINLDNQDSAILNVDIMNKLTS